MRLMMMRPQDLYPRLVQDTYRTISDDRARRQVLFRWIIKLIIVALVITAVVNFIEGQKDVALASLLLAASLFGQYWIVYIWKYTGVIIVSLLMTAEVIAVESFLLIRGTNEGFPLIWMLIVPPVAVILMGRKMGSICSMIQFLMLIFYLWTPLGSELMAVELSPLFKSRLPIIYLLLLVINCLAETLRMITVDQLRESRRRVEDIYQQQYSSLHRRVDIAKKTRHDLRHHFVMINQYLEDGKTEEAKAYVNRFYKSLPFEEDLMYCEHYGTNALLTYFSQRASNLGVEKSIKVNYPKELPIPDEDLTVVFGNLLENALDANVDGKQRDPKRDRTGTFISTKHEGNGVGISSVKGIVEKHGGTIDIRQEAGEFIVEIIMF